jgi:methylenetetrahydrofolate reductase (NADPH)
VDGWKTKIDAILVADNPSANFTISAAAAAGALLNAGWPTLLSLNCRDRNRIALASEALGACAVGIDGVVCVSGDSTVFGAVPEAKPVFDLDSAQLISWLKNGRLYEAPELGGAFAFPDLCVGAAVNVNANPAAPQLMKARKKVAAGADFLVTLPVFNPGLPDAFSHEFMRKPTRIFVGVLLPTLEQVKARIAGVPGSHACIPEDIARAWAAEPEESFSKATLDFTRNLLRSLRALSGIAGVCVSAPGREGDIPALF